MKRYTWNGEIFDKLPGKLELDDGTSVSPVTEALFVSLGGTITDDGEPTPKERVCAAFAELIADLANQTDRITPAEFLAAARNGISSDLIVFARSRGVPETVIAEGRARIVEIMADALRFGLTWPEILPSASELSDRNS